jgi:endonuclease III
VSDKSQRLADLLGRVSDGRGPLLPPDGRSLLEVGFLCVLVRRLSEPQAEKTLNALKGAYADWNELRVSQAQEFQHLIQTKSHDLQVEVALDIREYLQEVFQKNHGFNLETLRGDLPEAARVLSQMPFLGASAGHYLLSVACPTELPMSPSIVRTLDRLGLAKRTSSLRKAQAGFDHFVPEASRTDFAIRIGAVIERWCDPKKPVCWECLLVDACPFGKKVQRDHKAQLKRLEVQRVRDEERRRRDEEKERKRAAVEEKRKMIAKAKSDAKRQRAMERVRRAAKRHKARKTAKKKPERDPKTRKKSAPKKSVNKKATHAPKKPAASKKKK